MFRALASPVIALVLTMASSPEPHLPNHAYLSAVRFGRGIQCVLDDPSGHQVGPVFYRVADERKAGAPRIEPTDQVLVDRVAHYVRTTQMYYSYFPFPGGQFELVYSPGAFCAPTPTWYIVLNGACNEFYFPFATPMETIATPDCWNPRRPWVPNDTGIGVWPRLP